MKHQLFIDNQALTVRCKIYDSHTKLAQSTDGQTIKDNPQKSALYKRLTKLLVVFRTPIIEKRSSFVQLYSVSRKSYNIFVSTNHYFTDIENYPMGVFDFTKDAGESTGNAGGTSLSSYLTAKLPDLLNKYGLEVDNPSVQFDNGTVTINGVAADQATKEKIILTLGNLKGVGRVEDNIV